MKLRAVVEEHLGSRDVARVLYGAIVGLALVLVMKLHPPTATVAIGSLVGTALAVGLAELYSEIVAAEARTRQPVDRAALREMALDSVAVVFGASFPAVFFVLAAVGLIDIDLAFTLSKWTGLALICGYGFLAARLSGGGILRALLHAAAAGAVGGALIALKALVH